MDAVLPSEQNDMYLDGELPPGEAARFEARLASDPRAAQALKSERSYRAFLARALAEPKAPAGLQDRIRARLDGCMAVAVAPSPAAAGSSDGVPVTEERAPPAAAASRWRRHRVVWTAAAACLLAAAGVSWFCLHGGCRYIGACAETHAQVLGGAAPLDFRSHDPARLAQFVSAYLGRPLPAPALCAFRLEPCGAGVARFASLASAGAPPGVFIEYDGDPHRAVTLLLHRWPAETPTQGHTLVQGREFWAAERDGCGVVCWKSADGQVLCSLSSRRPLPEVLDLAQAARESLAF